MFCVQARIEMCRVSNLGSLPATSTGRAELSVVKLLKKARSVNTGQERGEELLPLLD